MADINIERKPRSAWPWILLMLVVLAAAGAWWYLREDGELGADSSPAAEVGTTSPAPPAYDPATAPLYPATPPADSAAPPDSAG